ncbi:PepSY domain-containing protein [Evansella sp. AB-rgal1]|uniref:PepSY domain-containing protein n=1 Tax=Evansella sp. AB-rgal1 TaxID=3242696 RepID=UPI00359E0010
MVKRLYLFLGVGAVLLVGVVFVLMISSTDAALLEEEVAEIVSDRFSGQVTSIELVQRNGHPYYDVEFLSPNGVYYIQMDGESGLIHIMNKLADRDDEYVDGPGHEISPIGMEEAERIIKETVSEDSRVLNLELVEQEGRLIYRIQLEQPDGIGRFEVDALTGEILLYSIDAVEDDDSSAGPITRDRAIEIALGEVNGEVDDVDLEEQNGRLVYEIEIENKETDREATLIIDAYTGEILSVEWDD